MRGRFLAAAVAAGLAVPAVAGAASDPVDTARGLQDRDVRTNVLEPVGGAAHRRAGPRRPGRVEPVRHALLARAARRSAGHDRPRLERDGRRARLAVAQPLALPPDLDAGPGAGRRQRAGRGRHARRHAAPDDRRTRRLGRRHGHHRRDQGRQRVEGRLGVVVAQRRPDARRQGPPARRPGLAGRRRQRRPRQVVGADRAPAGQGPSATAGRACASPAWATCSRLVRWPSPPSRTAMSPASRRSCSTPRRPIRRVSRLRRRAQRHRPRAREPRRQRGRRGGRGDADDPALRHAPARGRRLRHPEGPVHGGRRRRRARHRRLRQRRQRGQRHRPAPAPRRHRRRSSGGTPHDAERIRYAPTDGVPAGDYFVQLCEFKDGSAPVEPRTYTGSIDFDTTAPPAPYTARWRADPANPPLNPLPTDPWNNPSTDTRANMCWKQSTTPSDCDMVVGNLASRSPWDFSPHANASTNTTAGNNARSAESWQDGGQPGPNQFHPVSTTRDYTFPWTNEWFNKDCDPGTPYGANFQVGKSFDVSAAAVNLFTVHNRMHDCRTCSASPRRTSTPRSRTSASPSPSARTTPSLGDVQAGAATGGRPACTPAREQREHVDAARRRAVDHQHVPLAAGGGRVLPALRRRRLRRRRSSATSTAT